MINDNIYITYIFKDRNTNQLIQQLVVRNTVKAYESVLLTIQQLTEKYSLSAQDIIVEN
ncbi:hypothetical protein [Arcticibacter sp.]|jgi:hypothetical protein|uniref:hypothetical protein n=1 Tax=Arcticibacter sp. TaxID=1872630 RepID=UPI00388FFA84